MESWHEMIRLDKQLHRYMGEKQIRDYREIIYRQIRGDRERDRERKKREREVLLLSAIIILHETSGHSWHEMIRLDKQLHINRENKIMDQKSEKKYVVRERKG